MCSFSVSLRVRWVFSWCVEGSPFWPPPQTEQRSTVCLTLLMNICMFGILEAECRKTKTHACQLLGGVGSDCFPHVIYEIASCAALCLGSVLPFQALGSSPYRSWPWSSMAVCWAAAGSRDSELWSLFLAPPNVGHLASVSLCDDQARQHGR